MTHRHTKPAFAGHQAFVEERKASTPVSAASNRKRALVGVRVEGKRFMARIRMPRPRVVPHSARRRQGKHLNLVRQGKQVNLGGYASEREASFAYDVAALRYGRPLNYPSRGESGPGVNYGGAQPATVQGITLKRQHEIRASVVDNLKEWEESLGITITGYGEPGPSDGTSSKKDRDAVNDGAGTGAGTGAGDGRHDNGYEEEEEEEATDDDAEDGKAGQTERDKSDAAASLARCHQSEQKQSSRYCGVSFQRSGGRNWLARIQVDGLSQVIIFTTCTRTISSFVCALDACH